MAARSRRVSDEEVLWAAVAAMFERGPGLTLAEVGAKVGLSAATVVQQFGSKRSLMLRAARLWMDCINTPPDRDLSPIDRLLTCPPILSELMREPAHVANVTACMHIDLADPEFREIIVGGLRAQRRSLKATLDDAIDAGDLTPSCDTENLARLLSVACHGALQTWAIEPEGQLSDWIAKCLETMLAPWRLDAVAA